MPQPPTATPVEGGITEGLLRAGLVGRGIALSRTPAMHEAEGRAQGLDYSYALFDLDAPEMAGRSLAEVVTDAEARGFAGLEHYPMRRRQFADAAIDGFRVGHITVIKIIGDSARI